MAPKNPWLVPARIALMSTWFWAVGVGNAPLLSVLKWRLSWMLFSSAVTVWVDLFLYCSQVR
jgi:hypothetical protein